MERTTEMLSMTAARVSLSITDFVVRVYEVFTRRREATVFFPLILHFLFVFFFVFYTQPVRVSTRNFESDQDGVAKDY